MPVLQEGDRPQHTYQSACFCCCCFSCPSLEEEEEEEEGQRRESKGGGERMRGTGGEKRVGERDNKEDRGPLPADAVELILCSIHCVMAASSWSSQSQHSCHSWIHPLQMVKG